MRSLAELDDMVVVTHEMGFAREVGDRLVFIDEGVIVEQGNPATVLQAPTHERTQRSWPACLTARGASGSTSGGGTDQTIVTGIPLIMP